MTRCKPEIMTEADKGRLDNLEKEVRSLRKAAATSGMPAIGIAGFVAFCGFVWIMSVIPLPVEIDSGARFWIGTGSLVVGIGFLVFCVAVTESATKALVEVAVILLAFTNVLFVALVWSYAQELTQFMLEMRLLSEDEDDKLALTFCASALVLFVFDVSILLFLYPVAKAARSSIFD